MAAPKAKRTRRIAKHAANGFARVKCGQFRPFGVLRGSAPQGDRCGPELKWTRRSARPRPFLPITCGGPGVLLLWDDPTSALCRARRLTIWRMQSADERPTIWQAKVNPKRSRQAATFLSRVCKHLRITQKRSMTGSATSRDSRSRGHHLQRAPGDQATVRPDECRRGPLRCHCGVALLLCATVIRFKSRFERETL